MVDISLIVLTYNRPNLLRNCLESILKLEKGGVSLEVIVVDDGSKTDNSSIPNQYEHSLKIRFDKKVHQGVAAARNYGVKLASGKFIAFIADDYCLPKNFLIDVLKFFDENDDALVITHNISPCGPSLFKFVQRLYFQLTLWQSIENLETTSGVLKSYSLPPSRGAVFRKEIFNEIGLFNEELVTGEDGEFGMRMASHGIPVYFFPDKYIEHWEQKDLLGYIDQRLKYGSSHLRAIIASGNNLELSRLSFLKIFASYFPKKILIWTKLGKKMSNRAEYVLLSPFIVIFLLFFYLGFYTEFKRYGTSKHEAKRVFD